MRESGRIVAEVLTLVGSQIRPGVTTRELDGMAEDFIRSEGGVPAFKGYGPDRKNRFPATLCVSIDDVVVHGIPGKQVLEEGQIVSVDVGVKKDGYYGDAARSFAVGRISERTSAGFCRSRKKRCTRGYGRRGQGTTCMTYRRRSSDMRKLPGTGWCGTWWDMASARICTKSRRSRTLEWQAPVWC